MLGWITEQRTAAFDDRAPGSSVRRRDGYLEEGEPARDLVDTSVIVSGDALEVVRKAIASWESGDWDLVLEAFDPDVEWITDWPDGARFRGLAGLQDGYRKWWGTWESGEAAHEEPVDAGRGVFVSVSHERARGKGSGVEVERRSAIVWTVRDGKIVRMESFADTDAARKAAGLPS
jgi:ketosteroid isomerase-like protein